MNPAVIPDCWSGPVAPPVNFQSSNRYNSNKDCSTSLTHSEPQKRDILFLIITLANLNRFLHFISF